MRKIVYRKEDKYTRGWEKKPSRANVKYSDLL